MSICGSCHALRKKQRPILPNPFIATFIFFIAQLAVSWSNPEWLRRFGPELPASKSLLREQGQELVPERVQGLVRGQVRGPGGGRVPPGAAKVRPPARGRGGGRWWGGRLGRGGRGGRFGSRRRFGYRLGRRLRGRRSVNLILYRRLIVGIGKHFDRAGNGNLRAVFVGRAVLDGIGRLFTRVYLGRVGLLAVKIGRVVDAGILFVNQHRAEVDVHRAHRHERGVAPHNLQRYKRGGSAAAVRRVLDRTGAEHLANYCRSPVFWRAVAVGGAAARAFVRFFREHRINDRRVALEGLLLRVEEPPDESEVGGRNNFLRLARLALLRLRRQEIRALGRDHLAQLFGNKESEVLALHLGLGDGDAGRGDIQPPHVVERIDHVVLVVDVVGGVVLGDVGHLQLKVERRHIEPQQVGVVAGQHLLLLRQHRRGGGVAHLRRGGKGRARHAEHQKKGNGYGVVVLDKIPQALHTLKYTLRQVPLAVVRLKTGDFFDQLFRTLAAVADGVVVYVRAGARLVRIALRRLLRILVYIVVGDYVVVTILFYRFRALGGVDDYFVPLLAQHAERFDHPLVGLRVHVITLVFPLVGINHPVKIKSQHLILHGFSLSHMMGRHEDRRTRLLLWFGGPLAAGAGTVENT